MINYLGGDDLKNVFYNKAEQEIEPREYASQVGLQGMVMGELGEKVNISNENLYNLYVTILSLLLGIILTTIIYWIYTEFNVISALLTFIVCLFSPYLNAFGNNLYWVEFTWFLPMTSMILLLSYFDRNNIKYNNLMVGLVTFITVLIKVLNGNEYITTIGISLIVPLVYYAIKNVWKFKEFFVRALNVTICAIISFFTGIGLWLIQLKSYYGVNEAIRIAKETIIKRIGTKGEALASVMVDSANGDLLEALSESMTSNVFEVIKTYLKSPIFPFMNSKTLIYIFAVFFVISLMLSLIIIKKKIKLENYRKILAINVATAFSILAPLSWYVLAKGHSYIHIHMNHVLWILPFALLVPVAIIQTIICFCKVIKEV